MEGEHDVGQYLSWDSTPIPEVHMSELTREQVVENIARLQMHYSHPISFATQLLDSDKALRQRLAEMEGQSDLWRDEFKRIKALDASGEINGICDRAMHGIERLIPLTKDFEAAQANVAALEQENDYLRCSHSCTDDELKAQRERAEAAEKRERSWKQVADTQMLRAERLEQAHKCDVALLEMRMNKVVVALKKILGLTNGRDTIFHICEHALEQAQQAMQGEGGGG